MQYAILAVIAGEFCFALMGAIIKTLSPSLPVEMIVFFRNALAFVIIVPLLAQQSGIEGFKTKQFGFHALRGCIGLMAMTCFFYILGKINFTEAILLKLTTPFFIPIIAYLWLKEKVSAITCFSIGLGFVGVVFITDPAHKGWTQVEYVAIGLLGACLAALAKVTIRRMRNSESSLRIVFYFSVFASLFSLPLALSAWQNPTLKEWFMLGLLASIATAGQLLVTAAYRRASAGKVGQYTYTSIVFSSLLGWYFWDEALTLTVVLGCVFIVSAGLINMKSR